MRMEMLELWSCKICKAWSGVGLSSRALQRLYASSVRSALSVVVMFFGCCREESRAVSRAHPHMAAAGETRAVRDARQ